MKESQSPGYKVLIFEGVQGSGKTSAVAHLSRLGHLSMRGIPTNQELEKNRRAESWKRSLEIFELSMNRENGNVVALDRSLWSQIAYMIRLNPKRRTLIYSLAKEIFQRRTMNNPEYAIVFLDVSPEISYGREERTSLGSRASAEEVVREVEVYQWLMKNLKRDGFNIIRIPNDSITEEEFKEKLRQLVD